MRTDRRRESRDRWWRSRRCARRDRGCRSSWKAPRSNTIGALDALAAQVVAPGLLLLGALHHEREVVGGADADHAGRQLGVLHERDELGRRSRPAPRTTRGGTRGRRRTARRGPPRAPSGRGRTRSSARRRGRSRSRGAARAAACASLRWPSPLEPICERRKLRRRARQAAAEDRDRGERDGDPRRLGEEQDAGRADRRAAPPAARRARRSRRSARAAPCRARRARRAPCRTTSSARPKSSSRRITPHTSSTRPTRTHSSTSGNGCHGARGRSSRRAAARRGGARRRGRRQRRPAALAAALAHQAKGQPEETLTRHHPMSRPSGPSRGRTCQARQPGRPSSALVTLTQRWRLRGRVHRREQLGAAVGAQVRDAVRELVADALELAQGEQARAGLRRGGAAGARGLAPREARWRGCGPAPPPAGRSGRTGRGARRARRPRRARAGQQG